MIWRIEVAPADRAADAAGSRLKASIFSLGIRSVERVNVARLYFIDGDVTESRAHYLARTLLKDPITEVYALNSSVFTETGGVNYVSIVYNPGVMDPTEESILKAARDAGIDEEVSARTGFKYAIYGNISEEELHTINRKLLHNPLIQHPLKSGEEIIVVPRGYDFKLTEVAMGRMTAAELNRLSHDGQLFLSEMEMLAIQGFFRQQGRNPTDCELETIAQTWSEHCSHKTFRGVVHYNGRRIDNLLKETIVRVTEELNLSWCVSVFEDNAGIIEWDEDHNLCFKVETHNHPSALEPYGGAGTGIGGVIRDALGTGLGAKPICNTDVFCFGPLDYPHTEMPPGTLHPRRVTIGVVAGVRDYGNRMGIPTLNGAVFFDRRYLGNPVVYCGTVGIIPKEKCEKFAKGGDRIVVAGGRTGKDGIHGVTFSSARLTDESEDVSAQAVQIGNPITEKKLLDTLIQARDLGLYRSITDCGGGGLSSAVGEMGRETGARVELDRVPVKYAGLSYTDIWISESQERMVLSVPQSKVDDLIATLAREGVEATSIGEFTGDGRLKLTYQGGTVCDLSMDFLHSIPRTEKEATWKPPEHPEPEFDCPRDLTSCLLRILSAPNVCSKEWIIRQYDHEVQGGSVVKPLTGLRNDGPSDAAVIRPLPRSLKGVAISNGINPLYGDIDPYWMAASAIDEAVRNSVAVGGSPLRTALLDNFSWGSSHDPESLGALVRAAEGCYHTAKAYRTPFISGKDSLNNVYEWGEKTISIPHTLLISAVSIVEDVEKVMTTDLKKPGNLIYLVGHTRSELGASHYYATMEAVGNRVPRVDTSMGMKIMQRVAQAIGERCCVACHDLSEGGLAVALAEMAIGGDLGVHADLRSVPRSQEVDRDDTILFSESNSRFLVEVRPDQRTAFESKMKPVPFAVIGEVTRTPRVMVNGLDGTSVVDATVEALRQSWQTPLSTALG